MHALHPTFTIAHDDCLAFASARGFGLFVAWNGQQPTGAHLPFVIKKAGERVIVRMHVARHNPLADLADGQRPFLLVATGLDAYISNDWYASPDQVSTWLYEAVHLTGTARRVAADEHRQHCGELLQAFEAALAPKPPWHLDKMDAHKRSVMLGGIVCLEMTVTQVEGQRKFNQHKPDNDHIAIVQALERVAPSSARELAQRLKRLRPHLNYS